MFKVSCLSLLFLTACGAEFTAEPSLPIQEEAGTEAATADSKGEAGQQETGLPLQDAAHAEASTDAGSQDAMPDTWYDAGDLTACCMNASDQYWRCIANNPIACPNGGQTIPDGASDRWCLPCEPTWNTSNHFCQNLCVHP